MTKLMLDSTTSPDETPTFGDTLEAARKTNAKADAENRRLIAENIAADKRNLAKLDDIIASTYEMNDRLREQLRSNEPWRYSDSRLKRGCSQVWRGIKWWFNQTLRGCFYIAAACLLMLMVHWVAQAGGMIAGRF